MFFLKILHGGGNVIMESNFGAKCFDVIIMTSCTVTSVEAQWPPLQLKNKQKIISGFTKMFSLYFDGK